MPNNTRIAPSPTGDMHLGTARTAYFNWLAARATGGKFTLRIDDTDIDRNKQECIDVILRTMDWLGLDYDHLVYQSQRFDLYRDIAERMVEHGTAKREDGGIVLVDEFEQPKGPVNLVLIKSNGSPSYHFSTVIDDTTLDVNWVIRGVDHESNLPKHQFIAERATGDYPLVTHLGLIFKDKKKMSKRDGAASMLSYQEQGYDPDAVLNFMLRMGWGPKQDDKTTKIIDRDRALELFLEHGNMKQSPCSFDQAKLDSFDRKYKAAKRRAA